MASNREAEEKRREKARNLRYKKPVLKELNLDAIRDELNEMTEACNDAAYFVENDDQDMLYNALDGNGDDVEEFKMQFMTLSTELETFSEDMSETYNYQLDEDDFDLFFVGIGGGRSTGSDIYGYDEFEGDYFGLESSFESEAAEKEAAAKLMRLTKAELIERAQLCFKIAFNFIALRNRYRDLEAALDILRAENHGITATIKEIEKAYEKAEAEGFDDWRQAAKEFDSLIRQMPDRVWIE